MSAFAWQLQIAFAVINVLFFALVTLAGVLVREKFRHINEHQARQDRELKALRADMATRTNDGISDRRDIEHLGEILEKYFEQLKEDLEEARRVQEKSADQNTEEHANIIREMRRVHGEPEPA